MHYCVMLQGRLLVGFAGPKALEWALDCAERHPGAVVVEVTP